MFNEEIMRELEMDMVLNKEKYQDILKEDEAIKYIMRKTNISTKEDVLENEEIRKLLHAIRLSQAYKRKIQEKIKS